MAGPLGVLVDGPRPLARPLPLLLTTEVDDGGLAPGLGGKVEGLGGLTVRFRKRISRCIAMFI